MSKSDIRNDVLRLILSSIQHKYEINPIYIYSAFLKVGRDVVMLVVNVEKVSLIMYSQPTKVIDISYEEITIDRINEEILNIVKS